jgi:hypothetical protein
MVFTCAVVGDDGNNQDLTTNIAENAVLQSTVNMYTCGNMFTIIFPPVIIDGIQRQKQKEYYNQVQYIN